MSRRNEKTINIPHPETGRKTVWFIDESNQKLRCTPRKGLNLTEVSFSDLKDETKRKVEKELSKEENKNSILWGLIKF